MRPTHEPDRLATICSLEDATRRRLYNYVAAQPAPVGRDEAARALALDRSLVAYHLDKLTDTGLLTASFARPAGRGGPGAGRPAKRYEPSGIEVSVSVPFRDYQLAADLLARAAHDDDTGHVSVALRDAAADYGREIAAASKASTLAGVLDECGYHPWDDQGTLRLGNCPFHRLARHHTALICGMNLGLLAGLAEATADPHHAVLEPAPDRCCVAFHSEPTNPGSDDPGASATLDR